VALPEIFPAKPGREKFILIALGPGIFLLQPESGRKNFRLGPVSTGKISSDYIERPGIFSGCRELIRQAIRVGFLQRPGHSLPAACGGAEPGLVVVGRTFGPVGTGPVVRSW
jgi:hypothetical protein